MGGSEPPDVGAKNQTPIPAKAVAALTHRVMASGPFKDLKTYLFFFLSACIVCAYLSTYVLVRGQTVSQVYPFTMWVPGTCPSPTLNHLDD